MTAAVAAMTAAVAATAFASKPLIRIRRLSDSVCSAILSIKVDDNRQLVRLHYFDKRLFSWIRYISTLLQGVACLHRPDD